MVSRNSHLNHCVISLLDRCKSMRELKQIHSQIIVFSLSEDNYVASKILFFSGVSDHGNIDYADRLFNFLSNPTIFHWNTIIRGYSRTKNPNRAISTFRKMLRSSVAPDYLTFPFLAKSCARLSSIPLGKSIHCQVAKRGIEFDLFVQNSLIHMYASCSNVKAARELFDEMPQRSLVSWNTMVDGYAKCGDLVMAREMFESMPERDVVSWSALIDGHVKFGGYCEALAIFERMRIEGSKANEVTMVSVLCACARLGALDQGRKMHEYVEENGVKLSLVLVTSLVDMYAKCGSVEEALMVFQSVPIGQTDVLIWNAIIGGLAMHGLSKESLDMFESMQNVGIPPDEITYLNLLSACAHGGLVEEARQFFRSLENHGMTLNIEHYACMVDVLARAGCLDEAYEFINAMPIEPTGSMLGALLSGCRTHRRMDLGEVIGKRLIELEPDHDGRYIGLSNIYAAGSRWEDAKMMREVMEKRGVKKVPGYSSVEVDGVLHRFIAHDRTPKTAEAYLMLNGVAKHMKLECIYQKQVVDSYEIQDDG